MFFKNLTLFNASEINSSTDTTMTNTVISLVLFRVSELKRKWVEKHKNRLHFYAYKTVFYEGG